MTNVIRLAAPYILPCTLHYTESTLNRLPVEPSALELLPQSVAAENCILPVGFRVGLLHLIVPSDFDAEVGRTVRFILDRDFTSDHAPRELLPPVIDFHYAASSSDIANCESQLKSVCPKYWMMLDQTESRGVRFCSSCERMVHFCSDQKELDHHKALGNCVAFCDPDSHGTWLGMPEVVGG